MAKRSQNRDKEILIIKMQVEQPPSLEKIEEQIRSKLNSQRVDDLLRTPGDEVVFRFISVGPHG